MAGRKIRDDLDGVTYVYVNDLPVQLAAGDQVPKGADVGEHLLAPKSKNDSEKPDGRPDSAKPDGRPDSEKLSGVPGSGEGAPGGDDESGTASPELTPPDGRSSRDAWMSWAKHVGIDIAQDASKDDIRAAVAAAQQQ